MEVENSNAAIDNACVLIADDDPTIRLLMSAALADSGIRIIEAGNGKEALEAFQREKPDLVVMDVLMPVMDGYESCNRIRQLPEGEHTPIIMVTGLEEVEAIDEAYNAGATDFITKPIAWPILRQRIAYILRASRTTRALAVSKERYALAARGANDGLWDWDLIRNRIYYSDRWKEMLGYEKYELDSDPKQWLDRVHPDDKDLVSAELEKHLAGETGHFESEHRLRQRSGDYIWILCRGVVLINEENKPVRMAGSLTDITRRKNAEEQLRYDALHDNLTRLPNRSLFLERVLYCINRARRQPSYNFAVVFLDLDRFKFINDSMGHMVGDQFLIEVSNRIDRQLREMDTLARLGGDEFTILFDDIDGVRSVTRIVDRILKEVAKPFTLDDQDVAVSCSMGITLSNMGYTKPQDMLRDADTAMYRAKALGKDRYEIFDKEMHQHVLSIMQLERELRTASSEGQFRVYYQPILSIKENKIAGFEALLRWKHPERGIIKPREFIAAAEESALIVKIGRWVLREACFQLRQWQEENPELENSFVSVNVSSREFAQPDIVNVVEEVLSESALDPACLKLELTENVLIENSDQALEVLNQLRGMGIHLSIDDFGTGYSSFSYLHKFPFDVLKIDRSFISQFDKDEKSREIVSAIISLAHNLGLTVVAEGSETLEELEQLKTLDCEYSQGYVFSKPLNPDATLGLIKSDLTALRIADQRAAKKTSAEQKQYLAGNK